MAWHRPGDKPLSEQVLVGLHELFHGIPITEFRVCFLSMAEQGLSQ